MMRVSEEQFRALVRSAIDELPALFRSKLDNVEIVVEQQPTREQATRVRGLLLGLYHGVPQSRRSVFMPIIPPGVIFLFQRNIELFCRNEEDLKRQIQATLEHEIGHHFGMTEDQLRNV